MRGQAVIDYLILIALVLLMAIITIALFGVFPDFGRGVQTKHAQDFWKNQARPFTINEAHYDASNGRIYLAIKSHSNKGLKIKKLYLNNTQLSLFNFSEPDLEGVGRSLCDSATCITSGCNCELNMTPYSTNMVTTEYFAEESEICGQQIKNALLNLELLYSDSNGQIDVYREEGSFYLVVNCEQSFNN